MATPASVACGDGHTLVVDTDGNLWGTGLNTAGQLGLGPAPRKVHVFTKIPGTSATQVACGNTHSMVIDTDHQLRAAGDNSNAKLGRGHRVTTSTRAFNSVPATIEAAAVACGTGHSVAIDADGQIWSVGDGSSGQIGRGNPLYNRAFHPVEEVPFTAAAVACGDAHTVVIDTERRIWVTGNNNGGRLGQPLGLGRVDTFTQLGGIEAAAVSCGECHTAVIDVDGAVWLFGGNYSGQLGALNPGTGGVVPTKVPGIEAAAVACGEQHTVIVDTDGNVWVSGLNNWGQLGLSHAFNVEIYEFTRVPGITATQVACGRHHTVLISDDALLVAGCNMYGNLGCGDGVSLEFARVELGTQRAQLAATLRTDSIGIAAAYELADAALA